LRRLADGMGTSKNPQRRPYRDALPSGF
jgi:hypothetical protein